MIWFCGVLWGVFDVCDFDFVFCLLRDVVWWFLFNLCLVVLEILVILPLKVFELV